MSAALDSFYFCPSHADGENPSLHVTVEGERLLAHCFACQANGARAAEAMGKPLEILRDPGLFLAALIEHDVRKRGHTESAPNPARARAEEGTHA